MRVHRRWPWFVAIVVLVVVVGCVATCRELTRPARLRLAALAYLEGIGIRGAQIGSVELSLRHGLRMRGVHIPLGPPVSAHRGLAQGPSPLAGPAGIDKTAAPPGISITSAAIECSWSDLLRGRVRPGRVAIDRVDAIVHLDPQRDTSGEVLESEGDMGRLAVMLETGTAGWPRFTIADAVLVLRRADVAETVRTVIRGEPVEGGYAVHLARVDEPNDLLAAVTWNPNRREIDLSSDPVDLRRVLALLPANADAAPEGGDLAAPRTEGSAFEGEGRPATEPAGQVQIERLQLRLEDRAGEPQAASASVRRAPQLRVVEAAVQGRGLRFSLPLDGERAAPVAGGARHPPGALAASNAYLAFSEAGFRFVGAQDSAGGWIGASCTLEARLRSAPVRGSIRLQVDSWEALLDLAAGQDIDSERWQLDSGELVIDGLTLPTADTYPAFVQSPQIRGPLWALLNHYEPTGKVRVQARYLPSDLAGAATTRPSISAPRFELDVEALDATCRFVHFPYQFTQVRGPIRIRSGRVIVEDLHGAHGQTRVRANGQLDGTVSWTGFALRFDASDVLLDRDLFAALPTHYQRLWEQVRPAGVCDVVTTVTRAPGSPETGPLEPRVHVEARLRSGGLTLAEEWRIRETTGEISIDGPRVHIHQLDGVHEETRVRLSGEVETAPDGTRTEVTLQLENLPLVHEIALGDGAGESAARLRFEGSANGSGRVVSGTPDRDRRTFALELAGGKAWGSDPHRPWVVTKGRVDVDGTRIGLSGLEASLGQGALRASGRLPGGGSSDAPWNVELDAQVPEAADFIRQFFPPEWHSRISALGCHGPADFGLRVVMATDSSEPQWEIDLRDGRFRPPDVPLLLEDVRGRARLQAGRLWFDGVSARVAGTGHLTMRQEGEARWFRDRLDITCALTGRQMPLVPAFIDGLPRPLAGLLRRLAASGSVDVDIPRLHLWNVSPAAGDVEGSVSLRDVGLRLGLELRDIEGRLEGQAVFGSDGPTVDAHFTLTRALVADRPLEESSGRLRYSPADRRVQLEEVCGRFCEGGVRGAVAIDPDTSEYELVLSLNDVSAAKLLPVRATQGEQPAPRRGRIDGEFWLRGRAGYDATRNGSGRMRVRGASFLQSPVLDLIARLRRPLATSDTVDEAWLQFRWEGSQLVFERVDVRNPDVRLVGQGTWNIDTDAVHMTLWAAAPEDWPRLQLLSEVVQFAGQQIIQYRVAGTLASPRVTPQPLHQLNEALRQLLREEQP